jgi:hypothetical protein
MKSARSIALCALLVSGTCRVASGEPVSLSAVVVSGQPAPGGGTFEHFNVESLPIVAPVNSRGQVAFFATLLRGAASEGLFLGSGGRIVKVALEGDPVPVGGSISGFGKHPIPALNEAGTVAFAAAVAGGRTVEGIFVSSRGKLQAVALAGAAASGIPSGTFANVDSPALNDRNDVAFLATVRRGRETIEAVYVRSAGALRKVVAQGDPAPAGGVFAAFGAPALNNRGAVAFAAVVEGRAVPGGIFVSEERQLRMIVGAGDDTPLGGIFMKFSERVALNDAGTVAFHASLKSAPSAAAIFTIEDGRPRKVAALGDPAPEGGSLSNFGPWPAIDASGGVGFAASVDGATSPVGVFVARATGMRRLAAIGDALPGSGKLATFSLYPLVAMSPRGSVTFATAPTATGEGTEGLYLVPPAPPR